MSYNLTMTAAVPTRFSFSPRAPPTAPRLYLLPNSCSGKHPRQQLANVTHHEANKCQPSKKKTHGLDFIVMRATITSLYSSPGGDNLPAQSYSRSKYLMMSVYEMEVMQGLKIMARLDIIH